MRTHPTISSVLLPLTLLGVATTAAQAEQSPWGVAVSEQVVHDSNLLRAPAGQEQAATALATGLRLMLDMGLGRGQLKANLAADAVRYRHLAQFDHTGLKLDTTLIWATVERISGELGAEASQQLYRFDQAGLVQTERSLERIKRAFALVRVGVVTDWTWEAGLTAMQRNFVDAPPSVRDQQWVAAETSLRYQANPDLMLRLGVRSVDGAYQQALREDDDFKRHEVLGVASWQATGASLLTTTVGVQRELHTLASTRDSSLWFGSLAWRWQPTGKLQLDARLSRDSNAGSTESTFNTSDAYAATSGSLAATWLPTAKLRVDAQARRTQRQLDNTFSGLSTQERRAQDVTDTLGLTLSYKPARWLDLACSVNRNARRLAGDGAGLTYAYASNDLGCSGQIWLR